MAALAVVLLIGMLSGCKRNEDSAPAATVGQVTTPVSDPTVDISDVSNAGWILDSQLYCEKAGIYSGPYVEDRTDKKVENVAVVLITNKSDRYLDIAILSCRINGKDAEFKVTGLPAGESAWVLESGGMQVSQIPEVEFVDSVVAHRDGVVSQSGELRVTSQGNTLQVTNESDRKLYNVYVYYKVVHSDGNFLGGITYGVGFGDLEPGQSGEIPAGHYQEGATQIIRVAWLDAPAPESITGSQ